jgi:hypothetical protein
MSGLTFIKHSTNLSEVATGQCATYKRRDCHVATLLAMTWFIIYVLKIKKIPVYFPKAHAKNLGIALAHVSVL